MRVVPQNLYPEWEPLFQQLASSQGTVAVIGAVDSGKTTFSTLLANRLLGQGSPVAVADLDLGQSEIGPPAMLGYTLLKTPVTALSSAVPQGLYFVGYYAPVRHLTLTLLGAQRLLEQVRTAQPRAIVVDTCGYVLGVEARFFKLMLLDSICPDHIVAIQRRSELEPILEALDKRENWQVHRVPIPSTITRKSAAFRAQRRRTQFADYFANASLHTLSLDKVSLLGKRLGTGIRLSEEQLKRMEGWTKANLPYAERLGSHLFLITPNTLTDKQVTLIQRSTRTGHLTCLAPDTYENLLVGLSDYAGRTFGLGILQSADFHIRTIQVLSPVQSVEPVRWVHLGTLRLQPDGTELGELRVREA